MATGITVVKKTSRFHDISQICHSGDGYNDTQLYSCLDHTDGRSNVTENKSTSDCKLNDVDTKFIFNLDMLHFSQEMCGTDTQTSPKDVTPSSEKQEICKDATCAKQVNNRQGASSTPRTPLKKAGMAAVRPHHLKTTGHHKTDSGDRPCLQDGQLPQSESLFDLSIDTLAVDSVYNADNMESEAHVYGKIPTYYGLTENKDISSNDNITTLQYDVAAEEDKDERDKLSGIALVINANFTGPKRKTIVERRPVESGMRLGEDTQQGVKTLHAVEQPHLVYPGRAGKLPQVSEPVPQEYNRLQNLHAAVAFKPEIDFPADLGKTTSLRRIETVAADILFLPGYVLPSRDQPFWEVWRLGTFSFVEDLATFAIRLAQSGFFYDTQLNNIICFSCSLTKRNWEKFEKPATTHLYLSPDCRHANFKDERNVPISSSYPLLQSPDDSERSNDQSGEITQDGETSVETPTSASPGQTPTLGAVPTTGADTTTDGRSPPSSNNVTTGQRHASTDTNSTLQTPQSRLSSTSNGALTTVARQPPPSDGLEEQTSGNASPQQNSCPASSAEDRSFQGDVSEHGGNEYDWKNSQLDMRRAASPSNASIDARYKSFIGWPATGLPSSREMVFAGFYYMGISDSARCFYCGITLRQWKPHDDPWTVHARYRFSCDYVRAIKGEDFVRQSLIQAATGRESGSASNGGQPSPSGSASGSTATGPTESPPAAPHVTTASSSDPTVVQASGGDSAPFANNQVGAGTSQDTLGQTGERQSVERLAGAISSPGVLRYAESQPGPGVAKYSGVGIGNLGTDGKEANGVMSAAFHADGASVIAARFVGAGIQSQSAVVGYAQAATPTGSDYREHGSAASPMLSTDGTAGQLINGSSLTSGGTNGRNTPSQANRAATNQDRRRLPPANQTSANTVTSTHGESNPAVRNSQSDSLNTDSEPYPLPQNASPSPMSLPVSTITTQNLPRGSERAVSGSSARREHPEPSRASRVTDADVEQAAYLQQLQETNQRLRRGRTCRICRVRDVDTIFMPCGHLCTCASCASTIPNCCLCNSRIRATALVYLD